MEAPPTDIPPAEIRCLLGDTIDVMATFPDATVDLVLNDPPYGCTANSWDDASFNLERCWQQYERILKPNGIVVLFACSDTSDEPFLTKILNSKRRRKSWENREKYHISTSFGFRRHAH